MVLPSHQQSYLFVGSPHLGISGLRTTGHEDRSRLVSFLPCQAGSTASSPPSLAVITLERCPVPLSWQMSTVEMFPAAPLLSGTPLLWSCTVGLLPTCSLRNCLWSQYPASWIIETPKGMQKLTEKLLLLISDCWPSASALSYSCRLS